MRTATRLLVAAVLLLPGCAAVPAATASARVGVPRVGVPRVVAPRVGAKPWAIPNPNPRWPLWAPMHRTPSNGPRFNDPYGDRSARRSILRNVIDTINSVPGYHVKRRSKCPTDPAVFPAEIKISLYSIADMNFVDSLIAADRRCVSVQLLMNDHLDATTSPSWGKLLHAIGNNRHARSWTYRCKHSCRGGSVLHSKFYLFSQAGRERNIVMVGSSNMTTNATHVQWNDLYTAAGHPKLYRQFRSVFEEMKPDRRVSHPLRVYDAGSYESTFWPQPNATASNDRMILYLKSIRCGGATGGTGTHGHTLVYITMHAWHSLRGQWIANEVRHLYNQGCYVRILYSFMGHGIFNTLKHNTGPRMEVLRTLFPHPGTDVAAHYSHMKNLDVSGNVAGDTSARVVWTGSNNFTNMGIHADEVMIRIPSVRAYDLYVQHWKLVAATASPIWAIYQEPSGGGRAPDAGDRQAVLANGGKSPTPAQQRTELPSIDTSGQDMD